MTDRGTPSPTVILQSRYSPQRIRLNPGSVKPDAEDSYQTLVNKQENRENLEKELGQKLRSIHFCSYRIKFLRLQENMEPQEIVIKDLEVKVEKLIEEKIVLERRIEMLENEIGILRQDVQDGIDKTEQLRADMNRRIAKLEHENKELVKLSAYEVVVGKTLSLILKEMYTHVHHRVELRKRGRYSVKNIEEDIMRQYATLEEREAARERWERLKVELKWDVNMEDLVRDLIERPAHPIKPPTNNILFRDALRKMAINRGDIEEEEETSLYTLYSLSKEKFNL